MRDSRTSRRLFLSVIGTGTVVATAGCSGLLGEEPATVQWSLGMVGDDEPITDAAERTIDFESYFADGFEVLETGAMEYTVEVLEGPAVNVFVLDEANNDAFEANEAFEAVEGSIDLDVSFVEHPGLELDPGLYALIIYNGDDVPKNA